MYVIVRKLIWMSCNKLAKKWKTPEQ